MSWFKNKFIYRGFHRILDTRTSSRWFGKLANAPIHPTVLHLLIRVYIWIYRIDMSEYDLDLSNTRTFNEFFTRKLKSGARDWQEGICSPVDGHLLSYGKIENNKLFQVKGMEFRQDELTGDPTFKGGSFVNLYLSPADYHRVHAPFDMHIQSLTHIPGKLLSVSKKNASTVRKLYTGNERVILSGTSSYGPFHIVLVGALNVGSIGLSHFPKIKTNLQKKESRILKTSIDVSKGEEIGWFEMGSTVLILIEGDELNRVDSTLNEEKIKLGMALA